MKAYSQDLRERVLADYDAQLGTWTIGIKYKVSASWIRRLVQRRRESGEVTPRSSRNQRQAQWLYKQDAIQKLIQEKPDLTLRELQMRLGTSLSIQTLSRALHAMKLTFNKVPKAAEQDRPDVASQRVAWVLQQAVLDPDKLVFLDETSAKTNMVRLYGRSPQGQRLVEKVPYGHWKSTTFLAALRSTGLTAPMVIDGAMNGPLFLAYLQQILTPTLQPGDVVIMDNLPAHKVAGVKEIVQNAGA